MAGSFVGLALICLVFFKITEKPSAPPPEASPSPSAASAKKISALIVPHHDLVKDQRATLFDEAAALIPAPRTVILLSPNHYESGRADIQTSNQTWDLSTGQISPDLPVLDALVAQNVAAKEPGSFTNEHGIKLILPDIKSHFPEAQIVPIIFKMDTPAAKLTALEEALEKNCADCLAIASVDFSHYQPATLANLHDGLTERALANLDTDALLAKAEVDSPPALAFLTLWAKSHGTEKFVLKDHTNSGVIANNPDIETTTHLFGWYEAGERTRPAQSVSFLFGGDMMFGRMIAHTFLAGGLEKSLDQLGNRVFWGTDAGIVNLEGPVSPTRVPDDIRPNNLVFNFPPQTTRALTYLKVNAASQANNHSANAGAQGLANTREVLKAADIQPIGGPGDADIDQVGVFKGEGMTLYVIGVHTLASVPDLKPLITRLKAEPSSRVIVFPHWGVEYVYKHTGGQESQAHAWIDAGADLVIGAHPHVIEDSELYKGRPIIYSMGNLLFDQTFSKETQQGLLIGGEFTPDGLRLFALPQQSTGLKPALLRGSEKEKILSKLYAPFTEQEQKTPYGTILFFPKPN